MKRFLFVFIALAYNLVAKKYLKRLKDSITEITEDVDVYTLEAPAEAIHKVFEAHGGLQNWKNKRTLSFSIPKPNAFETHVVDLYSRKEKIETPEFNMGFDGTDFWLLDEYQIYKGDPIFYHNLMFYFYSMPLF